MDNLKLKLLCLDNLKLKEGTIISLFQHFEADFLWKVSLKILNSGLILKTFTHAISVFHDPLFI